MSRDRCRWSVRRGFSLVELTVAMAILATTGAIALPFYEGHLREARVGTVIGDPHKMQLILDDRNVDDAPPATLADAGLNMTDPCGQMYRYLWLQGNPSPAVAGKRRRGKSMNPVNADYDLYSIGPDGRTSAQFSATKAHDDIGRANDGDFIHLAADY